MSTLTVGTIAEKVTDAGVSVDGVTLKDGGATFTSAITATDNTVDLGASSTRFKDIYLGGGAYIGGTGSANFLDDYEFGSWTPVVADASSGGNTASGSFLGQYIKVGKLVQIYCALFNINTSGMTSGNSIHVQGLPFTVSFSDSSLYAIGVVETDRITFENYVTSKIAHGNTFFTLRDNDVNVVDSSVQISDVNSSGGSDIHITLSYPSA